MQEVRHSAVTVAVTRLVDPAQAREADAWARAGQDLARQAPGYLGSGWVRDPGEPRAWHMLYRFADPESLAAWEGSPERAWWIAAGSDLVRTHREQRLTGIEGWFDVPVGETGAGEPMMITAPPRWKQAVSIFVVFFPLSLLVNWLLGLVIGGWPLPVRVLLATVVLTPLMTYLFLPWITALLRPWLHARPRGRR
ncbi:antibiotic biosynthesis monooxygenase [Naumannella cuiyingiana]|uniref:ABM domain-containing protein n=1 Tax=Naumannella cuiyingiana TaxID=1347891 RepID=A0A7Z0IJF5_9ACTN|nr:hypothetical protein [Naumannella cuiyingiana]